MRENYNTGGSPSLLWAQYLGFVIVTLLLVLLASRFVINNTSLMAMTAIILSVFASLTARYLAKKLITDLTLIAFITLIMSILGAVSGIWLVKFLLGGSILMLDIMA